MMTATRSALVREILEATGATVATAHSGQEALEKLQRSTHDVLLADLGMPLMNGFELIDRVPSFRARANPRCAGCRSHRLRTIRGSCESVTEWLPIASGEADRTRRADGGDRKACQARQRH